ncbi:unnamed protein product [Merluccius merluccius]
MGTEQRLGTSPFVLHQLEYRFYLFASRALVDDALEFKIIWTTAWSQSFKSGSCPSGARRTAASVPGVDAKCAPPADRAGPPSSGGPMAPRRGACTAWGTKVSLANKRPAAAVWLPCWTLCIVGHIRGIGGKA